MPHLKLHRFFSIAMAFMLILSLGMALVSTSRAQADCPPEVWVAPPPTGNDSNPGTQAEPFATIQKGVDMVCAGGKVHVAAGEYYGDIYIGKPLSLLGAGRDVVTVQEYYDPCFGVEADNVRISGFTIEALYSYGINLYNVSHCSILNNNFTECYYGILLEYTSNSTISNNNVYDGYCDGIYLYGSWDNTVSNNNVYDNWGDGIVVDESDGNEISDNNVYGNLGWSCPYVYSWNGEEYKLDSQLLGNAPEQPRSLDKQKSDCDSLDYLVPSEGKHLLKLTEELDETSYVDELQLFAVDHVTGSKVVMDTDGDIHTLCSPSTPVDAVDEEGIDCLDKVRAQDSNYWTSDMENKDFSNSNDLRDGVILTFDKPADATSATVVVNYKKTGLGAFIHVNIARITPPPDKQPAWQELRGLLNNLRLQVKDGDTWTDGPSLEDASGSTVGRDSIANITNLQGDTLTIKIDAMTGLVEIDSVTVYYSECDEAATSVSLPMASAIDGNGTDVSGLLADEEGDYLVLNKGDYVDLNFYYNEPVSPGYERSYFVKASGYYLFPNLQPELGPNEKVETLVDSFLAKVDGECKFYNAYRFYLEKYMPSPGGHCGISIGYSYDNVISGNQIYDNTYEAIWLYESYSNRIIGNSIYDNDCGIWIDCADNNEILCNDIRDNYDWSGIVIDYDYGDYYSCYSSGNTIHNNNIVGNLNYGLYTNSATGQTVDAINNWWGAADGPSHSPGNGDKVSDSVEYRPWLLTEVQCKECAENGGVLSNLDQLQNNIQNAGSPGVSPQNRFMPPSFTMQYMNIHPLQAHVNQPVTITTNVVNSGQESGNYDVVLKVNGKPEQTKMVSVAPGATYPVNFTVAMSQPGTYTVNIDNQQGSFMVLDDGKNTGSSVNIGWIAILVLGALAIVVAVFVMRALRRSY
jgi:parallel beta-helix repeat protein